MRTVKAGHGIVVSMTEAGFGLSVRLGDAS
jgi:hypothetical protein